MFSKKTVALVGAKKNNKWQRALARAAQSSLEPLEGRLLLAYGVDTSFGGDGMVEGQGGAVFIVQPDMKVVARANPDQLRRINTNGTLDTTFGSGGTLTTPFPIADVQLSGSRILVLGSTTTSNSLKVAAYNLNGILDTTFGGGDGIAEASSSTTGELGGSALTAGADGKIIAAGSGSDLAINTLDNVVVARFNSNGTVDTTFAGDGTAEQQVPTENSSVAALGVQSDGKVLLAYNYLISSHDGEQWQIVRLNANGTSDKTVAGYDQDFSGPRYGINDLDVAADDSFVVANGAALYRFKADATRDPAFDINGLGLRDSDPEAFFNEDDWITGVYPQADGKILVTGYLDRNDSDNGASAKAFIARVMPNGKPDITFSDTADGIVITDRHPYTTASDVRPDSLGRLIVGGSTPPNIVDASIPWLARVADFGFGQNPPQRPFHGTPFHPGDTIQAEDFDTGGEELAYHERNAGNSGGAYRNTQVDIEITSDTGGGYDVGWIEPQEWLEYTVDLGAGGPNIPVDLRLASPKTGGMMRFVIDPGTANAVTGPNIAIPNTGGFQTWRTVNTVLPTVEGGVHVVRVEFVSSPNPGGMVNFNWMKIGTSTGGGGGTGTGLKGEYFNNSDFTAPVLTRADADINFNWGTGSPAPGIDPDTFSVRWTGKLAAPTTGRYTFYTTTDDGVRLWVNNQLIIDKLVPQAATEWSGSIDLVGGQKYDIRMDYFERAGGAQAKLSWSGPGIAKQIVPASAFSDGSTTGDSQAPSSVPNFRATRVTNNQITVEWNAATDNVGVAGYELRFDQGGSFEAVSADTRSRTYSNVQSDYLHTVEIRAFDAAGNRGPTATIHPRTTGGTGIGNGLAGHYFNNMDFTSPVLLRDNEVINFNWGTGSPGPGVDADTFSVRWTGEIQVPTTGRYTFYTTTDDGARLTINGQRIIDKLVPQSTTEWSGSIDLVAGQKYNITLEYIERAGGANAKLQWSGPNISKQVVPQANLFS